MNLWAKASRLSVLLVLTTLFFASCKEELGNVGTDINGSQFDLLYKEFTLPSHVIIDSVNTASQDLIAGSYVDPDFGTVSSKVFTEYAGATSINLSGSDIVFDSLMFNLNISAYYYGAEGISDFTFTVHELTEEISDNTNFSTVAFDPEPLGQVSYTLNPEIHDALTSDTTVSFKIDEAYFQRMKDVLTSSKSVNGELKPNTTTTVSPDEGFFGLAILTSNSEKIISIGTASRLTVHYHKDAATGLTFDYGLGANGFNNITSDRSGTALEGIIDENPSTPFSPANDMRYVQNGTGITTEIDLQEVLDFLDPEQNTEAEHLVLNSVYLEFGQFEIDTKFDSPNVLLLSNTDENSELTTIPLQTSTRGEVNASFIYADSYANLTLPLSAIDEDNGAYSALPTQYFQDLYNNEIDKSRAVLRGAEFVTGGIVSTAGYSVDRLVFHKDSIKLKMYYTIPKK